MMTKQEQRENAATSLNGGIVPLIMRCADGFYFIDSVPDVPLAEQARDHGELNAHILRVELAGGRVLWERTDNVD